MTEAEIIWREEVIDFLGDYWEIKGRPDLFNDVVDHVLNVYFKETLQYTEILGEAFKFLQTHCTSAVSSADLNFMAEEQRRKNEQSL